MADNDLMFFKQASTKICGSLDIKTALEDCFRFLKNYMPVNGIAMNIYDPEKKLVRNLALISDLDDPQIRKFNAVALPKYAEDYLNNLPLFQESAQILNHPKDQIIAEFVWRAMGQPELSFLLLHLVVDKIKLGVVFIFSKGFHRYKKEHARLFTMLHDPFAIALSNTLKHQEVLKLKELLADDNRFLSSQLRQISGDEIIGCNRGLKTVMEMVAQVASFSNTVLLSGETGVGKEVIANAIHYASSRANGPFIKINCGAIPENLIDSELFGHEKGAFTGAVQRKRGRFERADQGTIFLDEIGELPLQAQVRLLRVIQNHEIERVGGSKPVSVDIRIIAASHRNLKMMVEKGEFREDLWFRLNVFPILIPPLRERFLDMPELVHYFICRKSREMNLKTIPVPAAGVIEKLSKHNWPGNIRELENTIERALISQIASPLGTPLIFEPFDLPVIAGNKKGMPLNMENSYKLDALLRQHIKAVLEISKGRIKGEKGAAELLGINPSTLRSRMKKLGISYGRKCE